MHIVSIFSASAYVPLSHLILLKKKKKPTKFKDEIIKNLKMAITEH